MRGRDESQDAEFLMGTNLWYDVNRLKLVSL